jgi:hypothetical protein
MMGRLRPGVSIRQAQARLAGQFHEFVTGTAATAKEKVDMPALWLEEGAPGWIRYAASIRSRSTC